MQELEIGDITLRDWSQRVQLSIAEQQSWATWSVAGASMAVGWLLAWIVSQDGQQPDAQGHFPVLDKTLRELLMEVRG